MDEDSYVSFENITYRYSQASRHTVLEDVSLDIKKGTVAVIMGSSGCGKSTMAALMAGLYPEHAGILDSGRVLLCGSEPLSMEKAARTQRVGMMFQNPDLQFCMDTLRKEMVFCLENISCPAGDMDRRIQETVRLLGMEEVLDRKLYTLSSGEKQKAALCCLFLLDPEGFILDEPCANVDEAYGRALALMLKKRSQEQGSTIIIIDHRLSTWLDYADEIFIVGRKGRLAARFPVSQLSQYRDLFEREGLAYPGPVSHRAVPQLEIMPGCMAQAGEDDIVMEDFTLRPGKDAHPVLMDARVCFPAGRISALLGPSGVGKTTFFHALCGYLPYHGHLAIAGREVRTMKRKELARTVGIVFQNPAHQFVTTGVLAEVVKSLELWEKKLMPRERTEKALHLLSLYGLEKYTGYSPFMLSQGQQRRLAVLTVLCGGQKVLLLDEPTYGQDGRATRTVMEHVASLVEAERVTVLFTTHEKDVAFQYAHALFRCEEGGIVPWKA